MEVAIKLGDKGAFDRKCGGCSLCCRLLPVEDLDKPSLQRCKHQYSKGCRIYAMLPLRAPSCHVWACQWLVDEETRELKRPDHSHYVVDINPDFVGMSDDKTGKVITQQVMQVWCDPAFPDAHRDPALRRYVQHVERTRDQLTLCRFGQERAILLVPPNRTEDGKWWEKESAVKTEFDNWRNPAQFIHDRANALKRLASERG